MRLLPLLVGLIPLVACDESSAASTTESSNSTSTSSDESSTTTSSLIYLHGQTGTANPAGDPTVPTGEYVSYSTTMIVSGTDIPTPGLTGNATASSSPAMTRLVGNSSSGTPGNATASSSTATSTSTPIVNTRPCNGWPEFCSRSYSNITMITAHNSPFSRPDNAASNQALGVIAQLDDGVRMLQFQVHMVNNTLYLCHTSCNILNVGTLESYLTEVAGWMEQHPYDVVTFLVANYNQVEATNFIAPFKNAGLLDHAYTPPKIPMGLDDWPDLSHIILSGKRAMIFMDYKANQTEVPWLMDEFSQMWETPFSPTDRSFPCTIQRPPGLKPKDADSRMYMANHNLNVEVSLGSLHILVPNTAYIIRTNDEDGFGSLGRMAENCTHKWDRPPNFLLVDYYNWGKPNGSVFAVAAEMNNVSYNYNCCGLQSGASSVTAGVHGLGVMLAVAGIHLLLGTL